jgi:hypothetical protein
VERDHVARLHGCDHDAVAIELGVDVRHEVEAIVGTAIGDVVHEAAGDEPALPQV